MSVLEQLAATVIRRAVDAATTNDVLLTVAGAALKALERFSTGQQSADETRAELDALADHDKLGRELAEIRARSLEHLASKR